MSDAVPSEKWSGKWRVPGLALGLVLFCLVSVTVWIRAERNAAEREYMAYERLCAMGASGDDWVSFREFVTGKPPIVQLDIPAGIPSETAIEALSDLKNLDALTLAYSSLSADQVKTLQRLKLSSLRFEGSFPQDADVTGFGEFHGLRFLYVPAKNLSVDAQSKMRSVLPSTRITFE